MTKLDVVLIDNCGCELARETTSPQKDIYTIIKNWVLIPGDTIRIEKCETEEQIIKWGDNTINTIKLLTGEEKHENKL